jgi:hypothetical protein
MRTPKQSDDSGQASRRRFTKSVATAIATAPLVSLMAKAQTPPGKTKEATAPPNPQPSPTPQQQQQPSPVADAYEGVARARFGEQVTVEQFEQIKKDLRGNVRAAGLLREVKLRNGDEPDFTFIA